MKCYIRRYEYDAEGNKQWTDTYYSKSIIKGVHNHWVCLRQEAKLFESVAEARKEIKENQLKNCDVYKI